MQINNNNLSDTKNFLRQKQINSQLRMKNEKKPSNKSISYTSSFKDFKDQVQMALIATQYLELNGIPSDSYQLTPYNFTFNVDSIKEKKKNNDIVESIKKQIFKTKIKFFEDKKGIQSDISLLLEDVRMISDFHKIRHYVYSKESLMSKLTQHNFPKASCDAYEIILNKTIEEACVNNPTLTETLVLFIFYEESKDSIENHKLFNTRLDGYLDSSINLSQTAMLTDPNHIENINNQSLAPTNGDRSVQYSSNQKSIEDSLEKEELINMSREKDKLEYNNKSQVIHQIHKDNRKGQFTPNETSMGLTPVDQLNTQQEYLKKEWYRDEEMENKDEKKEEKEKEEEEEEENHPEKGVSLNIQARVKAEEPFSIGISNAKQNGEEGHQPHMSPAAMVNSQNESSSVTQSQNLTQNIAEREKQQIEDSNQQFLNGDSQKSNSNIRIFDKQLLSKAESSIPQIKPKYKKRDQQNNATKESKSVNEQIHSSLKKQNDGRQKGSSKEQYTRKNEDHYTGVAGGEKSQNQEGHSAEYPQDNSNNRQYRSGQKYIGEQTRQTQQGSSTKDESDRGNRKRKNEGQEQQVTGEQTRETQQDSSTQNQITQSKRGNRERSKQEQEQQQGSNYPQHKHNNQHSKERTGPSKTYGEGQNNRNSRGGYQNQNTFKGGQNYDSHPRKFDNDYNQNRRTENNRSKEKREDRDTNSQSDYSNNQTNDRGYGRSYQPDSSNFQNKTSNSSCERKGYSNQKPGDYRSSDRSKNNKAYNNNASQREIHASNEQKNELVDEIKPVEDPEVARPPERRPYNRYNSNAQKEDDNKMISQKQYLEEEQEEEHKETPQKMVHPNNYNQVHKVHNRGHARHIASQNSYQTRPYKDTPNESAGKTVQQSNEFMLENQSPNDYLAGVSRQRVIIIRNQSTNKPEQVSVSDISQQDSSFVWSGQKESDRGNNQQNRNNKQNKNNLNHQNQRNEIPPFEALPQQEDDFLFDKNNESEAQVISNSNSVEADFRDLMLFSLMSQNIIRAEYFRSSGDDSSDTLRDTKEGQKQEDNQFDIDAMKAIVHLEDNKGGDTMRIFRQIKDKFSLVEITAESMSGITALFPSCEKKIFKLFFKQLRFKKKNIFFDEDLRARIENIKPRNDSQVDEVLIKFKERVLENNKFKFFVVVDGKEAEEGIKSEIGQFAEQFLKESPDTEKLYYPLNINCTSNLQKYIDNCNSESESWSHFIGYSIQKQQFVLRLYSLTSALSEKENIQMKKKFRQAAERFFHALTFIIQEYNFKDIANSLSKGFLSQKFPELRVEVFECQRSKIPLNINKLDDRGKILFLKNLKLSATQNNSKQDQNRSRDSAEKTIVICIKYIYDLLMEAKEEMSYTFRNIGQRESTINIELETCMNGMRVPSNQKERFHFFKILEGILHEEVRRYCNYLKLDKISYAISMDQPSQVYVKFLGVDTKSLNDQFEQVKQRIAQTIKRLRVSVCKFNLKEMKDALDQFYKSSQSLQSSITSSSDLDSSLDSQQLSTTKPKIDTFLNFLKKYRVGVFEQEEEILPRCFIIGLVSNCEESYMFLRRIMNPSFFYKKAYVKSIQDEFQFHVAKTKILPIFSKKIKNLPVQYRSYDIGVIEDQFLICYYSDHISDFKKNFDDKLQEELNKVLKKPYIIANYSQFNKLKVDEFKNQVYNKFKATYELPNTFSQLTKTAEFRFMDEDSYIRCFAFISRYTL